MFLRIVADSFSRRLSRKLITAAALALGMAVATAALSVSLDVGDRLAREFRSLGANLVVTPAADSLPLEIGGVDYRPANAGAYLPEGDLGKLKTIFWRNNIVGFAPVLDASATVFSESRGSPNPDPASVTILKPLSETPTPLIGTWARHKLPLPDGRSFVTGVENTNPWWHVAGRWFEEGVQECVLGEGLARRAGLQVGSQVYLGGTGPKVMLRSSVPAFRVVGIVSTGDAQDEAVFVSLADAQELSELPGEYRRLYVSALTKPEDDFGRRDPKTMSAEDFDRWFCTPYISAIALQIQEVLSGTEVRVIRRVAEGEGRVLTRVRNLLWLVTLAALLAAALAVGATTAASILERRTEISLMKALGAGSRLVAALLAAEQILLALTGGVAGYALGIVLARFVGQSVFGASPEPSPLVFAIIVSLAAVVTLAGSAISLRRAARFQPAPILRGE